ncbi:uncharacterized protein LOC144749691 [Ciona intestinalis]
MESGRSYATAVSQDLVTRPTSRIKLRPHCISFRTATLLNREGIWDLLDKIKFSTTKLQGISERKGNLLEATCKTRTDVLELQEKLLKVECVYAVHLFVTDKTTVAIGWTPIPLENDRLTRYLEENYGKVHAIKRRKDKRGMDTGLRIVVMAKDVLKENPIPSYISVDGYQLYVKYNGQKETCKYCNETGHKIASCPRREADFLRPRVTLKLGTISSLKLKNVCHSETMSKEVLVDSLEDQNVPDQKLPANAAPDKDLLQSRNKPKKRDRTSPSSNQPRPKQ